MAIVACRGPLQTSQSAVVAFSLLLLLLLLLLLARFAPLLSPFFRAPMPPSQNLLAASISRDVQLLSFPLLLSYFLWTLVLYFFCCYSSSELFFRFLFALLLVCLILNPRVVKLSSSDSCLWYPSVPFLSFFGFLFWSFFWVGLFGHFLMEDQEKEEEYWEPCELGAWSREEKIFCVWSLLHILKRVFFGFGSSSSSLLWSRTRWELQ